jgi:acyl carrier protein
MISEDRIYEFLQKTTQLSLKDLISRQHDDDVIDSLTRIELASIFEEEMGISMSLAEIEQMTSVHATISLLRSKA